LFCRKCYDATSLLPTPTGWKQYKVLNSFLFII
jgi:hypothetical protein